MKTRSFIAIIAMCLAITPFFFCQKTEFVSKKEQSLPLEAPSGQRIAGSVSDLKTEASGIIASKFGSKKEFQITNIEYLPSAKGFAAIISYELSDGTSGNYASFSGIKFQIAAQSISTSTEGERKLSQFPGSGSKVTLQCNKLGSCECRVQATINAATGVITWKCSCEQCEAVIIVS